MKDRIRANLDMIEHNMSNFNKSSLEFMDLETITARISEWRWFISHDYFKKDWPQPTGYNSKPELGFLDSQLQGLSVPLARDIGTCIAPVVESGLKTEHAARRIMNRLDTLYMYVSPKDELRSQQDHRDREDKKTKDRLRAAKARVDRKAERKEKQEQFIKKEGAKLGEKYLKEKKRQREAEQNMRAKAKAATRKAAEKIMKERK